MGSGYAVAAANTTVAVIQANAAVRTAEHWATIYNDANDKQDAIARRIEDRADEQQTLWRQHYKECTTALAQEVCAEPDPVAHIDAAKFHAEADFRRLQDQKTREATRCVPLNSVGALCHAEREMSKLGARTLGHAVRSAQKAELARVRLLKKQHEANLRWAISTGQGAYQSGATALGAASSIYGAQASIAAAQVTSSMGALGASFGMLRDGVRQAAAQHDRDQAAMPRPDPADQQLRDVNDGSNPYGQGNPEQDIQDQVQQDYRDNGGDFDALFNAFWG
jgi:hypothetical protein